MGYIKFRATLGLIGSVVAFFLSIGFLINGIVTDDAQSFIRGIIAFPLSIIGFFICLHFLKEK